VFKILYVDHASALGGAEYSLLLLLKHLDRKAFIPLLACREGLLAQEARALGIQVEIVPLERLRGVHNPFLLFGRYWRGVSSLRAVIERERVELVHSNVMRASLYAAAAAKLTGVLFLWHVRDIHTERWYSWLFCRLADRVIATSQAVARSLPCSSKMEAIPNGVEVEIFDPHLESFPFRQELGLASDVPLVGIVGRIRPWKGQTLFLEAASQVASQNSQVRFLVVGETIFPGRNYLEELKELAQRLGLGERVIFTGYRQDIPRVLASLDILVHCSQAEPFGRVLIEGMAMSKPIVAFTDGATPEIVKDGETGLLVPPGDVGALAQAILNLLGNEEQRQEMGRRGQERVKANFDVRPLTRRIEEIYQVLLRS
jgi:glycosyltransferase involved in cell wall biosynthesis